MNVSGLPDQPSGIKAFHGTADDFVKFQLGHPNRKDVGWLGHGLYFTNSPEMAMANAKMKAARKGPKAAPRVMSVRLNIQNPYYATLEDKARLQKANSSDASMAFTEALKGKGHDGVIWKSGDYHEYVAFHPDQVEVLPEEKAEGGKVDSDLKTAQRLGMDTSSIPEIRKAGQLREAHKSLGEKVRERADESYKRALEYHQSGKLPFPVGTRFITEKTRKMKQPPFKVVGHYVDGKDPYRYGYRTEQGSEGDPNYSSSLLMVSDPAGDARMEKIGEPFDRKAWWDSVQVLKGPTQVKAEGGEVDVDYRGSHTAPGPHFGAPLHDLTQLLPEDVYSSKAAQYYGHGEPQKDRDTFRKVHALRNKPNQAVQIYRAVPRDKSIKSINRGDWVTINPDYAKLHGESVLRGKYKILSKIASAKNVWTNGDSIHEWGYWPDESVEKAEGGPVTLDEMRLALINAPKMARGGRLTSRLPTLGNEGERADVVPPKLQGTNIVKEKGGQWLEGSLNPAIYNLESKGPTEADRAWIEQHFQQQPDNQEAKKVALSAIPVTEAINGWVNSTLRKYIMRDMGTEGDPVRALAERGILHVNPEQLNFKTEAHGKWLKPGQRHVAKSEEAKAWEGASDLQLSSSPASVIAATNDRAVEDNPWLASIDPNTPIHSVTDSRELRRDLGFDHLVDELQNAVRQDSNLPQNLRLRPESMQRMSVPQAVEHVHKINQWRAENIAKANREKAFNSAVKLHKDYPDSDYAWYEIGQSPEATPAIPDKTEPRWGVYNTRLPQSGFKSREEAEGYIQQLANMREELVKRGESPETINEIFGNLSPQIEDYNQVVERGSPSSDERLKEALKYEGDAMGHCVGGYSDEVASGNSRIFSLRNKKTGAPHVTIEAHKHVAAESTPHHYYYSGKMSKDLENKISEAENSGQLADNPTAWEKIVEESPEYQKFLESRTDNNIEQIKGKSNAKPVARYIPYVQDFVKSGKWNNVNDPQNAGLRKYTDVFNVNEQRLLEQKGAQVPDHLYLTGDQIQQMHNMIHQPGKRLKYDATGNIIGNDADSGYAKGGPISLNEMKLALLDRKAGGGQPERKVSPIGFYSPAAEAARNLPQETGTPGQMAAMLAKQRGVSDEMQHSGYGQKMTAPKVSRQDLVAHFESQMPDVQETVLGEGRVKSFEEWLADQGLSPSAVNEFGGTLRRSYEAFKNNNSQRAGGHKYSEHQLPGGENYREVLLTLPEKPKKETWEWYDPIEQESKQGFATQQEAYANRPNIGAVVSKVEAKDSPQNYQSPHWDQPNVLAHIRLNDRTDAEGKKVLFVEEMQSDWGQQGKKKGFYDPNKKPLSRKEFDSYTDNLLNDYVERQIQAGEDAHSANRRGMHTPFPQMAQELGRAEEYAGMRERRDIGMNSNARIPSAPFVTNTNHWVNLALKRITKMAVDGGYDKVAFVNGNQSADRYDLSKQVDTITIGKLPEELGKWQVVARKSGDVAIDKFVRDDAELASLIGKDLAEKAIEKNGGSFSGLDLKVGGEGMKAFYDKIVPAAINKLLPKIGGKKLGAVHLVNKAHDFDLDDLGNATPEELAQLEAGGVILHQPGFEVTPEMREHVKKGLPIFKTGGVMRGYAGGGTAQGTTMPTLAQMKMALMGLPKNLGSIGAQEAPDMNPKAYFPPDRQGRLPPGGAALTSGMPIGGIDMSSQMGQQLMPQQLMPQQGAQSPQGVQNPQVGPQEQGGLAAPQEAPQEPQQASSSGILGLTPQGQTMGALKPPMKAARGGGINYPTIDPKTLQNENDGANLQPVNWMTGGDVEGMAGGGKFKFRGMQAKRPQVLKSKRILINAEGRGGVKGIVIPRHTLEGSENAGVLGLNEINKARAEVYGDDDRPPLSIPQIGERHKEVLAEHFAKSEEDQIRAEQAALNRLRAAKHISADADTLDESEKLDTVRHEHDEQGRSHVGYAAKGVAGHAIYTTGTGKNTKYHVINTCPGQTEGCGGGKDAQGIIDTKRGTCFAPNAESQYPAAAVRRACHEQAKHDPAMTSDWILAHTGSLRNAAQRADKNNERLLFRPNVVDETDTSSRHAVRYLNEQREKYGLPPIIGNSYGKTDELHDPENGWYVAYSSVGPKTKHGREIKENIKRDKVRVRRTITATDGAGKDVVNEQGNQTPPKGSYMVTNVKRNSALDKKMQEAFTHAKYWSTGREQSELSESEKSEGPEGHFDGNGRRVSEDKSHYGHRTVNGKRYDYQRQHILPPRLVNVPERKQNKETGEIETVDHLIPTDSRFKDEDFLPKRRFKSKNGKVAGHILLTTPTTSTSYVEHHSPFTYDVSENDIKHALKNNGEWEIDRPEDQEKSRDKPYVAPQAVSFPGVKLAHGGTVSARHLGLGHDHFHAFPEQNFAAQRHLAMRRGNEEKNAKSQYSGGKVFLTTDLDSMRLALTKKGK